MRTVFILCLCCVFTGFLMISEGSRADERDQSANHRPPAPPDTTTPSRYYPLHVGDAWEYDIWGSPRIIRRDITDTVMLGDTLYYKWQTVMYENGTPVGFDFYNIRYDPTTSFIMRRFDEASDELIFPFAPCPLNADFDATVDCRPFKNPGAHFWDTSGTYEGELVFDESGPGTGGDTVRTSVKRYDSHNMVSVSQYAAGIGQVHVENELEVFSLYYARVDGVEHGVGVVATGSVRDVPEGLDSGIALSVFPNPVRDRCTLEVELDRLQKLTVLVFDVRGRHVLIEDLGELGSGVHSRSLDFSHLAPGFYVVRVIGKGFLSSTVPVSKAW